jgi:hypothetical protein
MTSGRPARLAVLALALLLSAADPTRPGRIESVSGPVEIGSGEPPTWRPARAGDELAAGDQLRTGANGRAELALPAGVARIYENSLLRIPFAQPQDQSDFVELEGGASLFDVIHRGRPFEVRTPEAVAMVKGTLFAVALDDAGAAVSVYRGLVGVRAPEQALELEVLVHPGSAAFGGADDPFRMRTLEPGADPWEGWTRGELAPPQASELRGADERGAAIESARAAALAAFDEKIEEMTLAAHAPLVDGKAGGLEDRAAAHDARGQAPPAAIDAPDPGAGVGLGDIADPGAGAGGTGAPGADGNIGGGAPGGADPGPDGTGAGGAQAGTGAAALMLGPLGLYTVTFIDGSGGSGSDRVRVVGPLGLSKELNQNQLEGVLDGNTSPLGAQILNQLLSNGHSPAEFAALLLPLL